MTNPMTTTYRMTQLYDITLVDKLAIKLDSLYLIGDLTNN